MFPPADQSLTHECLSKLFNETYKSFAGLFALASALTSQLIQTIAINRFDNDESDESEQTRANSVSCDSDVESSEELPFIPQKQTKPMHILRTMAKVKHISKDCCGEGRLLFDLNSNKHRQITAYVLEMGIAMHSIIIGLTLVIMILFLM